MFSKTRIYYSVEMKDDDSFVFVCSYSTFEEAKNKLDELTSLSTNEYRILKIEKSIEQIE